MTTALAAYGHMTPQTVSAYRRERARNGPDDPIRARDALRTARYYTSEPRHEWTTDRQGDERAEWTAGPLTIRATIGPDYGISWPDELCSGRILDGWPDSLSDAVLLEPSDTKAAAEQYRWDGRRPRWYVSDYTLAERTRDHHKAGAARHVARILARRDLEREADQETDDQRAWYAVTVTAYAEGIELARSTVGGSELSDNYTAARLDMDELADELAPDVIADALDALARLRAVTL
jgi:hypothetical protein